VLVGPGGQALLPVSLHRLGGHGDDRQVSEPRQLADPRRRRVPIHAGHHDVHQDQRHIVVLPEHLYAGAPVVRVEHAQAVQFQRAGQREDIAHVVVDDQDLLAGETGGRVAGIAGRLPRSGLLRDAGQQVEGEPLGGLGGSAHGLQVTARAVAGQQPRHVAVVGS